MWGRHQKGWMGERGAKQNEWLSGNLQWHSCSSKILHNGIFLCNTFRNDALNCSKLILDTWGYKRPILNKWCSFELLLWKKIGFHKPFWTLIIRNVPWTSNQHIRMTPEGSCVTEDLSNDAENSALTSKVKIIIIFLNIAVLWMQPWWA